MRTARAHSCPKVMSFIPPKMVSSIGPIAVPTLARAQSFRTPEPSPGWIVAAKTLGGIHGPQIFQKRRKRCEARNASQEEGQAEARQGRQRRHREEPQAGDRHRPV